MWWKWTSASHRIAHPRVRSTHFFREIRGLGARDVGAGSRVSPHGMPQWPPLGYPTQVASLIVERSIYLAFASFAFPSLMMAQTPDSPPAAPAPGEEKPQRDKPGVPIPVPTASEADPKSNAEPQVPTPGMKTPDAPPAVNDGSIPWAMVRRKLTIPPMPGKASADSTAASWTSACAEANRNPVSQLHPHCARP